MNLEFKEKIQLLRGIAIIAVIMIHTVSGEKAIFIRPFLNFAVALFIFLSGYLTNFSLEDSVKEFYKKRIIRVGIPYIIWSIIYTVAYGSYDNFIKNIMTGQACGIYYYILVYLQLTLLTPLSYKLVNSKYKILGFLITPIIIVGHYIYIYYTNKEIPYPWNANNFIIWYIYFYLGIFLRKKNYIRIVKIKKFILVLGLIIQLLEGYFWWDLGSFSMATTQLKISVIITNIVFLLLVKDWITDSKIKNNFLLNILKEIGNMSFAIYLSHILIINILSKFVTKVYFFPLNSILVLILSCLCVIIGRRILKNLSKYMGLY